MKTLAGSGSYVCALRGIGACLGFPDPAARQTLAGSNPVGPDGNPAVAYSNRGIAMSFIARSCQRGEGGRRPG